MILILLTLLAAAIAKKAACNEVLNKYDRDFFYCTKFSVGKG